MSTAPAAAAQLAALETALHDFRSVNVAAAAATAWLAYDILITLGQEVEYIWRAKWSFPKGIYLLSRYYSMFHLIFSIAVTTNTQLGLQFCKGWLWFVAYSGPVMCEAAVGALLIMRLYAVYNCDKRMLALLLSLYIIELSMIIAIATYLLSGTTATARTPGIPLPGCLASTKIATTNITLIAWIPSLLIQCLFFILTLYKFVRLVRIVSGSTLWSVLFSGQNITPIMALFMRDGAVSFAMILVAVLLNLVFIIVKANSPMNQMGTAWFVATYAIAGSRLVLNLKGFSHNAGTTALDNNTIELSKIRFKPPAGNHTDGLDTDTTFGDVENYRATFNSPRPNHQIYSTQSSSRTAWDGDEGGVRGTRV